MGFRLLLWFYFVALIFFVFGCTGPNFDPFPKQDEAVSMIMQEFGIADHQAPLIEWVTGNNLDCPKGPEYGWQIGIHADGSPMCVGGQTYSVGYIRVAMAPGHTFSSSGIVHEFGHVTMGYRTGDLDLNHLSEIFANGGAEVEAINVKLLNEKGL